MIEEEYWLYFRYTEFKFFVFLLLVLLQTLNVMHDKYIYSNTYSSVLRTFCWCQCQLVQTRPSPNLFLRAKKAKGWPHPNCLLLLICVNSWTLLGTLMQTAWAKSMSKAVLTTYQDEPGSISWVSIRDEDISNDLGRAYSERSKKFLPSWHYTPARSGQLQAKPSWSNLHIQFWGPKKVCSGHFQRDL